MFYKNYLSIKRMKEKLLRTLKKKEKCMNQEICIRDLLFYNANPKHSYGEYDRYRYGWRLSSALERMAAQIELIAELTNKYHQEYYCEKSDDGCYRIKKECSNKVTRALLNEFFLYLIRPITLAEYDILLGAILDIAKKQHENVHLMLSSIPVAVENKVLNMTLYIQCGSEPKIESIVKARADKVDLDFPNKRNYQQQAPTDISNVRISAYPCAEDGLTIPNNSVFNVTTAGGAQYTQAVDVCLDHGRMHSKRVLQQGKMHECTSEILPAQVDHVLTSNSIYVVEEAKISPSFVQIDPRFTKRGPVPLKGDKFSLKNVAASLLKKYPLTKITRKWKHIKVTKPPFGADFVCVPQEERRLKGFSADLQPLVQSHNKRVRNNLCQKDLELFYEETKAYDVIVGKYDAETAKIEQLFSTLLDKCRYSYLQYLFNTGKYKRREKLGSIIKKSIYNFELIKQDPADLMHHTDVLLRNLKVELEHANIFPEQALLNELMECVDNAISEVETIKLAVA